MKKTAAIGIAAAILASSKKITAHGWFKKAHLNFVEQAFEILENDGKSACLCGIDVFKDQLLYGAFAPDVKGDCDNGSGLHYYSPKNKFGLPNRKYGDYYPNRLGGYSKSAGTVFEECYYTALILWQNQKPNTAAVMLGRALHFLADMSCVAHTTSKACTGSPKNSHMAFETHANKYVGLFNAMTSKSLYEDFLTMSPIEIANAVSELSASFYEQFVMKKNSGFDEITAASLPFAQMTAAALIYRFCCEAKGEILIDENKTYTVKNCESADYLQADGTVSDEPEIFKLKIHHSGALGFESADGCPLTFAMKYTQFRLTLKNENLRAFRITMNKKFSRNAAEIPLVKIAAAVPYKPDSALHLWSIREVFENPQ